MQWCKINTLEYTKMHLSSSSLSPAWQYLLPCHGFTRSFSGKYCWV